MVYYTDGSCNGNGKITNVGGFYVTVFVTHDSVNELSSGVCHLNLLLILKM